MMASRFNASAIPIVPPLFRNRMTSINTVQMEVARKLGMLQVLYEVDINLDLTLYQ